MKSRSLNIIWPAVRSGITPTNLLRNAVIALVFLGLCLSTPAGAGNSPNKGHGCGFGKDLETWQELYWRWANGDVTIAPDRNGNAVVGKNVTVTRHRHDRHEDGDREDCHADKGHNDPD